MRTSDADEGPGLTSGKKMKLELQVELDANRHIWLHNGFRLRSGELGCAAGRRRCLSLLGRWGPGRSRPAYVYSNFF